MANAYGYESLPIKYALTFKLKTMHKENSKAKNTGDNGNDFIADVGNFTCYTATKKLRYKNKDIDLGNNIGTTKPRLQQMWQGDDGSDKWEWIEYVD